MRKSKLESLSPTSFLKKHRSFQILLAIALVYVVFLLLCEFPFLSTSSSSSSSTASTSSTTATGNDPLRTEEELEERFSPIRPSRLIKSSVSASTSNSSAPAPPPPRRSPSSRLKRRPHYISALKFNEFSSDKAAQSLSELHKSAKEAFDLGHRLIRELRTLSSPPSGESTTYNQTEEETKCPNSMMLSGAEFREKGNVMVIPCGLTLGSHITLVAKPYAAHPEYDPKIAIMREGDQPVMVSQFMMELQGLNAVDGEDPPRILHFNPRLKGDWSGRPVIEQNTCYRMQWGTALRCEGWKSRADEETVDGLVKCEKWIRDDDDRSEESKTTWWLNRLIGRTKTMPFDWPFSFVEDKLFVLTLSAGLEGYHVNVDGRHLTSFPYRTGFVLEDATGLSLNGDLEVHSIFAASLPTSHPSFAPQKSLEMLAEWQAPPLPNGPVELFIGILSAGNHFAE